MRPMSLSERSSGKQPMETFSSVCTETRRVLGTKASFCLQERESKMSRLATLISCVLLVIPGSSIKFSSAKTIEARLFFLMRQ